MLPPNSLSAKARSAAFVSASTETENVFVAPERFGRFFGVMFRM
jgi:hypothetical protein